MEEGSRSAALFNIYVMWFPDLIYQADNL
jgi:hypothetical protein